MASQLMTGDIVRNRETGTVAMVLRTGKQDEHNPPPPPVYPSDALTIHPVDKQIPLDSVGISLLFQKAQTPEDSGKVLDSTEEPLQVKKEGELELLDRLLQPGVRPDLLPALSPGHHRPVLELQLTRLPHPSHAGRTSSSCRTSRPNQVSSRPSTFSAS